MKAFSITQRLRYGTFQFFDHFLGKHRVDSMFNERRKKLEDSILKRLKERGPGKEIQIDRRKNLSLKEFKNHYRSKGIPVIFDGEAKDWGCCQKWSLDYFNDLHGDDEIVMVDQNNIHEDYQVLTLRDIIADIKGKGSKYYRFYPLLSRHPEHIADFDYQWFKDRRQNFNLGSTFQVFIGGGGKNTPIHNASAPNLFVQAYGEKRWVLYDVYYTPIVNPNPVRNLYRNAPNKMGHKNGRPFDAFNPNFEDYPEYFHIDKYEFVLKKGDILWNPPFMWHAVENVVDSIGVGFRWMAPFYSFKISPLYYFLELFATNPNFYKSWKLFNKDFNLIQLAETGRLDDYLQKQAKSI